MSRRQREGLSTRELLFLKEYLTNPDCRGNATEAAERAGFRAKDRLQLGKLASEVKKRPLVAARIRDWYDAQTRSIEEDLAELDRVAHMPLEDARSPISDGQGGILGYRPELRDKVRALEIKLRARGQLSESMIVRNLPADREDLLRALHEAVLGRLAPAQREEAQRLLEAAKEAPGDVVEAEVVKQNVSETSQQATSEPDTKPK